MPGNVMKLRTRIFKRAVGSATIVTTDFNPLKNARRRNESNNIEVLTSWNFKHIVNLEKIRLYNCVNVREGFRNIEIRTPREIIGL